MTRLSRLRRRRSLRTQLMWLALGPLLVSSILCFQRARSEQANLQHARALSSTALASSALGHLGSFLDYEHTMALGTALVLESGFPMDVVADAMGIDPRDAVVNLATSVDALEPVVTSRLDELGDASVGEVLQSLLAPRRELRAEAAAGALSVARVSAVYGELETFVAEQRAWLTPAIDAEARASGADQALIDALQASDTIGEWSTDLAKQGEMVGLMVVVVPSTPADAKALMGAAMVNGDRAFERLQELPSVRGTNLVEGSAPVSEWARLREALLVELGMTLKGTPSGDALVQTNLTGAYAIATTALLEAAAPVYAAIDADIVRGADTLVRDATRTLYIAAGAGALVSALAILWVILIARGVTGPLARLGRRAAEVSAGTLSSEPIGPIGPREVASLALAFDEVCGNLRHVERQTEALAAGRLDDEVLADRSPGCLGESLQRSIARVSDLTERLAQQARRDPMTGLPNRAAVIEHLTAVLHRCGRSGEAAAVLFVDLDGFKAINDAYGHGTGDLVLQEIATRFRRVARAGEMVARLGGDEFVLVAEGLHDAMAAVTMGDRLINAAQQQFRIDNATFGLSASVGVAIAEADSTPLGLLGEADQAVYQAKRDGKSRVRLFDDEMQNAMVRRTSLERDLRRALTADEFELYVQPVIDARTGDTWGAEALIRWNRPGHGIVPPVDFIPFAEESWLIVEIGRAVLDKACRLLAEWDRVGCELTLAVNIAGRHLAEGGLVADVRDALARHEVPPGRLSVELTESHLVTDLAHAARVLTELRALGVHVALDDFGTGHSSINYLRQLPIDTMKIDRSYIGEVGANDQANSLLASLMHLARSLRLDVVAEGVETDRQADHLRTIGCPKFQGFLFARPMPAAQFAVWEESHLLPR